MRIYSNPNNGGSERSYNVSWGYYVQGTTHWDRNDCMNPNAAFGWSEDAEREMVNRAISQGYALYHDWGNLYNPEEPRWEGNYAHYWQNSGVGSAVYVP